MMDKKSLKSRIQSRHRGLRNLVIMTVLLILVVIYIYYYIYKKNNVLLSLEQIILDFIIMVISALVSTTLAIYMTKDDILENDYARKRDEFGILTFENGYEEIFKNDDAQFYLHATNWIQFFKDASDKKICIVGVHIKGFFENDSYRKCLTNLCLENDFDIDIILANPYSDEVIKESLVEHKESSEYIKNKILDTYHLFMDDNKKISDDKRKVLENKFHMYFSDTLPKALIFKVGKYMIITPYLIESPNNSPTIVVENSLAGSFYETYMRYIYRLKEMCYKYSDLPNHILASRFFSQPYRNLSKDFYQDLNESMSLSILGLGQKHMITQIEPHIIKLLNRGGKFCAILADPEGSSTEMCVKRSTFHNNVAEARTEHKIAINRLLNIKNNEQKDNNVQIHIWDCFLPYTMYAFDLDDKNKAKIYIWITNMFEAAEKRLGFVIDGKNDFDILESFSKQYEQTLSASTEVKEKYKFKD